jgi:uncharacterized protein (DUF952 family)
MVAVITNLTCIAAFCSAAAWRAPQNMGSFEGQAKDRPGFGLILSLSALWPVALGAHLRYNPDV